MEAKTMSRAKQQFLSEEMRPKTIKELDEAADDYVVKRDERMERQKPEKDAKALLMALMLKHNLKQYVFDGKMVFIEPGEPTVKVKDLKVEKDDSDPEED
jgi:hypothetical protein